MMINFLKWLVTAIYCKMGFHETYTRAEDLDYKLSDDELHSIQFSSQTEVKEMFKELTAVRCRHCKYKYTGERYEN